MIPVRLNSYPPRRLFLTLRICQFDFFFQPCLTAHILPQMSSHPGNPQRSSFSSRTSPPLGWLPEMTDFAQNLICKGEEPKSIHILLETHWPELAGCVELGWLEYLAKQGKSKELIENFTQIEGYQENAADPTRNECEAVTRGGNGQTARSIVDHDTSPSHWDLDMLCNLGYNYRQQRAGIL